MSERVPLKVFSQSALDALTRIYSAQSVMRETCRECGFKVRGPNHEAGTHHRRRHPTMRGR